MKAAVLYSPGEAENLKIEERGMEYIPATVRLTIYDSGQTQMSQTNLQSFINDVEAGLIKLNLSQTFVLGDIVNAHKLMESNEAGGKIVVLT